MTQIQTIGLGMPVKTSAQGSTKNQTDEEALTAAMFAGIMQDAASGQDNFFASSDKKTDTKDDVLGLVGNTDKKSDAKTNYEAMSSEKTKRPEKVESKAVNDEKKADQTTAVTDTAEKVAGEIKETYGVSDEELETAMETLGLTMVDLLDTSKLASLVANLTDTDSVTALVADPTFTDLLATVNDMVTALQTEQGIKPSDFKQLLADINASLQEQFRQDNADVLEENVAVDTEISVDEDVLINVNTDENMTVVGDSNISANVQTVSGEQTDVKEVSKDTDGEVAIDNSKVVADNRAVEVEDNANGSEFDRDGSDDNERRPLDSGIRRADTQTDDGESSTQLTDDTTDDFAKVINHADKGVEHGIINHQQVANEPQVMADVTPEVVAPQTTYTYEDIQNLMEQVNGAARAMATNDSHTIQMQLNPENLGRLFMSVTEKQGTVTAQLTVTSEETRAALQSQLVELRANLENQGVKVEAVEVTVASHEFEQNLENQDATNREMMERQAREQNGTEIGGRRNISMDNLDEMSGVMTEEERIVASMMQMNGQSVDYLA